MDENSSTVAESVTQLADAQPQIDRPLRVMLPSSTNAPARAPEACRDDYIRTNAFSPGAFTAAINYHSSQGGDIGSRTKLPALPNSVSKGDSDAKIKTAISHYTVLAFSCHRAGKSEVEAAAYISLAVIHDNMGNHKLGIENYKNYLDICQKIEDVHGEAVACNCLGVNYMLMAWKPSDQGFLNGFEATEQSLAYIDKAIEYHQQHVNIADAGGKFVGNVNLGLCYGVKGEFTTAAKHQQNALRIAIKMQTLFGQSIAVGNLGMLATAKSDYTTARTCYEQHLQLVQSLQDVEGEVNAWKLLSHLSMLQENYSEAVDFLDHARRLAIKNGFFNELRQVICLMGMAQGNLDFQRMSEELVAAIESK